MIVHLPKDLERYIRSRVEVGQFASEDDAMIEAVRLLKQVSDEKARPVTSSEEELERHMQRMGLLGSIPSRLDGGSRPAFEPITIAGEPLSETVIRERR